MEDHCFDDELTPEEVDFFESEGIRYYSNVMTTLHTSLRKAMEGKNAGDKYYSTRPWSGL